MAPEELEEAAAAELPVDECCGSEHSAEREWSLPGLEGAERGKVVTRFPPEPNGYPHIGHAKAAIINEEYAKMYGGRKILRMDDTNPGAERMEYYAAIKVGLEWLGIEYDTVKNTSDDMDALLAKGQELVESGGAYVCTCKRDDVARNRRAMSECRCRPPTGGDPDEHSKRWHRMFEKYKPGQAAVRFVGDMSSPNTVMRDPVLFRVTDERHPLLGTSYRVWPSYDFAVAVEDSMDGVTHALRSKEYELRNELYGAILERLGMRAPRVAEFSRLELEGMPVSKRALRQLMDDGKVGWYDDPRLPTLEALRRRGIAPEAVRRFVASLGMTKTNTTAPIGALEAFNRTCIDAASTRLFMVERPVSLEVSGAPAPPATVPNHPGEAEMGDREIPHEGGRLYIESSDAEKMPAGGSVWLMGLGNVRLDGGSPGGGLRGAYEGGPAREGVPRVQWVPQEGAHRLTVLVPGALIIDGKFNEDSLRELEVLAEPHYAAVPDGSMIQFVRFGYCRKESHRTAVYAHR